MNFIKSVFFKPNIHINIEHFKSSENTENGQILHDFVGFTLTEDTNISNVCMAKNIAKKLGKTIFPYFSLMEKSLKAINVE